MLQQQKLKKPNIMRHTLATKSTTTNDGAYARKAKEKIALPWKQSTTRPIHETLQSRRDCNLCIHQKKSQGKPPSWVDPTPDTMMRKTMMRK